MPTTWASSPRMYSPDSSERRRAGNRNRSDNLVTTKLDVMSQVCSWCCQQVKVQGIEILCSIKVEDTGWTVVLAHGQRVCGFQIN